MKTICFYTIKGGTGKTTTVVSVGSMMAKAGKRVLLIDLDPQANLSTIFIENDSNNVDDFCDIYNGCYEASDKTVEALLLDDNAKTKEFIQNTDRKGLDIIPSTTYLAQAEIMLQTSFGGVQQWILKSRLAQISDDYDYCLIDCGPSIGILNANAIGAADEIYLPTKTDSGSFKGVAQMLVTLKNQTYNAGIIVGGCLLTGYMKATNNAKETYMDYQEAFTRCGIPDLLLPMVIRHTSSIPDLSNKRQTLVEADPKCRSNVAKDYQMLTKYIMSEDRKSFLKKNCLEENMMNLLI